MLANFLTFAKETHGICYMILQKHNENVIAGECKQRGFTIFILSGFTIFILSEIVEYF